MTTDRERIMRRVKGLLCKAEDTKNPEEAEAFTARAHEILIKYEMEHIDIDLDEDELVVKVFPIDHATCTHLTWIQAWGWVAKMHSAAVVGQSIEGRLKITVAGREHDVDMVEMFMSSLTTQCLTAMTRVFDSLGPMDQILIRNTSNYYIAWRSDFVSGFFAAVYARHHEQSKQFEEDAHGYALVRRDRAAAAGDKLDEMFPDATIGAHEFHGTEGGQAGIAAGKRADLGNARMDSTPALGA